MTIGKGAGRLISLEMNRAWMMVAGETARARRRRGKMEAGISQAKGRQLDRILERPLRKGAEGDGPVHRAESLRLKGQEAESPPVPFVLWGS